MPDLRRYLARRVTGTIRVDGRLDEPAWQDAPWTAAFTDIEGALRRAPRWTTRVRMLWDDRYWYIGAELREPDLWATIRQHDAVIFHDNDFEIFTDPSGSTHRYFEIELNALAAEWDLFLDKPYRDGGRADNGWEIPGLQLAVSLDGTLNDPRDRDRGWSVEVAIPWAAFADSGRNTVPPAPGTAWRVNFSRVEWDLDPSGGSYRKRTDPRGAPLAEHNWVWSPQQAVNMHLPEMWGVVQFGGESLEREDAADTARWALRRVYYAERLWRATHGRFTDRVSALDLSGMPAAMQLTATDSSWTATWRMAPDGPAWHIRADGLVWRTR
jgi:Carbohydrate family 9 binding domain-like